MYQLKDTASVTRLADGATIPMDPRNGDYQEYLSWLAAGNTPAPVPVPPVVIPTSVSMRQARLALLGAGVLSGVDAAINSLPSPQKEAAQIEWEFASEVRRDSALVGMLSGALGLDATALDALFLNASTL